MSEKFTTTDRRSFVKLGALAATPVAVLAPAAAMAADDTAIRLARMEDERAIADLVKGFVRRFNGNGDCSSFVASSGAIRIDPQVCAIREDSSRDPQLAFAADGSSASWQSRAEVDLLTDFDGDTTIEKMARFQGQGSASSRVSRRLEAEFARTQEGWTITRLALA
ncbi:hypothetical protein OZN62_03880 [Aurantiacibacter sp. MUD11]|uniref:hypothetical protein n=1 Tax=Aurantiacibacter sp. MUD11 TaxID=3003265 RepID=UPI0022AB2172|nr:hypothetical protein [Aurantiacibacter sp. MUD11]WAT18723.1 hypothetical protein OZN62_03880 [Aurantiacibacter sp. MUD11]